MFKKYFPIEEWESKFEVTTARIKNISEYTGLNFNEVYDLAYSDFLLFSKDSWIYNLKNNENGREFLENVSRLQQTSANLDDLHNIQENFKK